MTLPNWITISRIIGIPILLFLLYSTQKSIFVAAYFFGWILALTDFLDGYLSRKLGQISNLGKILDPIADKLFVLLFCLYFVDIKMLPAWVVLVLIIRELVISDFRLLALGQGKEVAVSRVGKWKATFQFGLLAFLGLMRILFFEQPNGFLVATWPLGYQLAFWFIVALAISFTLISLFEYFWTHRNLLKEKPV